MNSLPVQFSVVVCTRNPNPDYFRRSLSAIRAQSMDSTLWELLIVDNGSDGPLAEADYDYPENTRIVMETEPGIMCARMRGAREALGGWIVFVDDDNLLSLDYLEQGGGIIQQYPEITLFCGRIEGEFEVPPPVWLKEFYPNLAVIDFEEDTWSATRDFSRIPSWTAGMFLKQSFALQYYELVEGDPFRRSLNRCEDVDMVIYAATNGFTCGKFKALKMQHIIPEVRMSVDYLQRIVEETSYNMGRIHARGSQSHVRMILHAAWAALRGLFVDGDSNTKQIKRFAAWHYLRGVLAR